MESALLFRPSSKAMQEKSFFKKNPCFLAFIIFTLGITVAFEKGISTSVQWLTLPAVLIILLFLATLGKIYLSGYMVFLFLFTTVLFLGIYKGSTTVPDFHKLNELNNSAATIKMEFIVSEKLKSTEKWHKFIAVPAGKDPYNSRWIVFYPRGFDSLSFSPGEKIAVKVRPSIIKPHLNPSLFDYSKYLIRRGVYISVFIHKQDDLLVLSTESRNRFSFFYRLRIRIEKLIGKTFPDQGHAALQKAVLIGISDELDDDMMSAFRRSGAVHVLAISGLHVGIFSGIMMFFINTFLSRVGKGWKLIWLLTGIWTFVIVAGMQPSVFRAGLMFSICWAGTIFKRKVEAYQSLGLAGLTILMVEPLYVYSLGFQLSFLAVLGIVTFFPFLRTVFPVKNKIIRYVWEGLAVALSAQLTTLPVLLYNFREISMVFWLSGILVVPLMSILLPLSIVNLFLVIVARGISGVSTAIVGILMDSMIAINQWISTLNFAFIRSLPFDEVMLVISVLIIVSLALYTVTISTKFVVWGGAGIIVLFLYNYYSMIYSRYQRYVIQYADTKNIAFQVIEGNRSLSFLSGEPEFGIQNALKYSKIKYRISSHERIVDISPVSRVFPVRIGPFLWLSRTTDLLKADSTIVFKAVFIHGDLLKSSPELMAGIKTDKLVLPAGISQGERDKWAAFCRDNNIHVVFQEETGQVTYKY